MQTITIIVITLAMFSIVNAIYHNVSRNRIEQKLQRNDEVHAYRMSVIKRGIKLSDLPSYEEMLDSKLPLEDKYWLKD